MADITLHLEAVDGEAVWWAEAPGFTAVAPSLPDLRALATEALGPDLHERLDAPLVGGVRLVMVDLAA